MKSKNFKQVSRQTTFGTTEIPLSLYKVIEDGEKYYEIWLGKVHVNFYFHFASALRKYKQLASI